MLRVLCLLLAGAALAATAAIAPPKYVGQKITMPGTSFSYPVKINDRGMVVGNSYFGGEEFHGFFFDGVSTIDLGEFTANDINSQGAIAGARFVKGRGFSAEVYNKGVFHDLHSRIGKRNSLAYGINDHGDVVASATDEIVDSPFLPSVLFTSYLIRNDQLIVLDESLLSQPWRINNRADVIGATAFESAWLYRDGKLSLYPQHGWGSDLNQNGVIVGSFGDVPFLEQRAGIFSHGTWKALPSLPDEVSSFATGINSKEQIVGGSLKPFDSGPALITTPCLWQNNQVFNLNDLIVNLGEWGILSPGGINNSGVIIAEGYEGTNVFPVLLHPIQTR
jgi:uncharacterized membrane protein